MFKINDCLRAEREVWVLLIHHLQEKLSPNHKPVFTSPIFHKCTDLIDHNDCVGFRCCSKVPAHLDALQLALEIALDFVQADEK